MKKYNIIFVILLVFTFTIIPNVGAKTDKYMGNDGFNATIVVSPGISTGASNGTGGYTRHQNDVYVGGQKIGSAYCINPNASAKITSGSNSVTCRSTSGANAPMASYIAAHEGGADAETLDLAYRMVGMMDNNVDQLVNGGYIDDDYTLGDTGKQRNGAATIITTFQQYVMGYDFLSTDPNGYGKYVLQGGKVQEAAALAKAAYDNYMSGGAETGSTISGSNFSLTANGKNADGSSQFLITSALDCPNLTATTSTGQTYKVSMSGGSGVLNIPAQGEGQCDGQVSLSCDGAMPENNNTPKSVMRCSIGGSGTQSFVATIDNTPSVNNLINNNGADGTDGDMFDLADLCECNETSKDYNASTGTCEACPCGDVPPPSEIEANGSNCCGGEGYAKQVPLNEIFCDDTNNDPKVDHYTPKCGSEGYIESSINQYCDMYCRQEVEYKIPDATHSRAGRYFTLNTQEGQTGKWGEISGIKLKQTKNCRTQIRWNVWYKTYKKQLQTEVDLYNSTEMNTSHYLVWDDAIKANDKVTEDTSGEVTWSCTWPQVMQGLVEIQAAGSSEGSVSVASKYGAPGQIDTFILSKFAPKKERRYKSVKIGYNKGAETDYKYITVEHAGSHTADRTTYNRDTQVEAYKNKYNTAAEAAHTQADTDSKASVAGKIDPDCTVSGTPQPNPYNPVNPEEKRSNYKSAADSASDGLQGAAKSMIQIKKDLNDCDNYIYKKMRYESTPEMEFSYTQGYTNDYGKFVTDEIGIPFDKDCVAVKHYGLENLKYDGGGKFDDRLGEPVSDVDGYPLTTSKGCDKSADAGGCDNDRHSQSVYKTWDENARDFNDEDKLPTNKLDDPDVEKSHETHLYGEWFEARKPFTTDGYIEVKCDWNDSDQNNVYSVVPSGAVVDYAEENWKQTGHNRWYYTKKTHATGKFITYFNLSYVGEYGLFDPYITNIQNCEGSPGLAECYFEIENELIRTGKCNTIKVGDDCTTCPDACTGNIKVNYEFKEVDPSNLFPSASDSNGGSGYPGNYAWNWFSGPNGKQTKALVEQNAKNTYSPDQLTYSFTLTTSDMKQIREYNRSRTIYGGYEDFLMNCVNDKDASKTKHHCKSQFLDAISGGSGLYYDGKTLSLNTANINLETARSRGSWYSKE